MYYFCHLICFEWTEAEPRSLCHCWTASLATVNILYRRSNKRLQPDLQEPQTKRRCEERAPRICGHQAATHGGNTPNPLFPFPCKCATQSQFLFVCAYRRNKHVRLPLTCYHQASNLSVRSFLCAPQLGFASLLHKSIKTLAEIHKASPAPTTSRLGDIM